MMGLLIVDSTFRWGVTEIDVIPPSQQMSAMGGPVTDAGAITLAPLSINAIGAITGSTPIDWNNGWMHSATLTGNVTFTLSNPINGTVYKMLLTQNATGSHTVTWPGTVIAPGGSLPTVNSAPNSLTEVSLFWDGTNYVIFMNKTGS